MSFPFPSRRRDREDGERQVDELLWTWRTACIGAGLCHIVSTATGPTESVPHIVDVTLGPPLVFLVELLPGQVLADVRAVAHRLAGAFNAPALRVESHGHRHVRVELLAVDPLAVGTVARAQPVRSVLDPLHLGSDELRRPVELWFGEGAHVVVQGSSGSGKTVAAYGLLGQLADVPDALVVGSDVTGRTLAPWADRPGNPGWHAMGTRNLAAHINILERLVREMDLRIEQMPRGHDSVPITPDCPLIVAVFEEFPGLVRLLAMTNKDLEKRARLLLGRLFGEARKAGIRLVLIAQRADANVIGGFERDQCSHGIRSVSAACPRCRCCTLRPTR